MSTSLSTTRLVPPLSEKTARIPSRVVATQPRPVTTSSTRPTTPNRVSTLTWVRSATVVRPVGPITSVLKVLLTASAMRWRRSTEKSATTPSTVNARARAGNIEKSPA